MPESLKEIPYLENYELLKYFKNEKLFTRPVVDEMCSELKMKLSPEETAISTIFKCSIESFLQKQVSIKQNASKSIDGGKILNETRNIIVYLQYNFLRLDLFVLFNKKELPPIYFLNTYCAFLGNQLYEIVKNLVYVERLFEKKLKKYHHFYLSPLLMAICYMSLQPHDLIEIAIKHNYSLFWRAYRRFLILLVRDENTGYWNYNLIGHTYKELLHKANKLSNITLSDENSSTVLDSKVEWLGTKKELSFHFVDISVILNLTRLGAFQIAEKLYTINGKNFTAKSLMESFNAARNDYIKRRSK